MEKLFFITPIGEPGSDDRKRSDLIYKVLIQEICKELNIEPIRADKFNEATLITHKIFETIFESDYVICDLSNNNPNVFYEMAVRHCTGKPIIHIARKGQSLSFDIKDFNTIFIDHTDINHIYESKKTIIEMIKRSSSQKRTLNPITVTADLNQIDFGLYRNKDLMINEINRKFDQILEKIADNKNEHKIDYTSMSGRWISNIGYIDLEEKEDMIIGEYQYYSDDFVGQLSGYYWNDYFLFNWHWKNKQIQGYGYWKKGNDSLRGFWFYNVEIQDYDDLKERIQTNNLPIIAENKEWNIYGKQKYLV